MVLMIIIHVIVISQLLSPSGSLLHAVRWNESHGVKEFFRKLTLYLEISWLL
jgi:hypothetical protein